MSNLPNFPILRPSLLLDFANSKSVDPRITFTRASTATYFDAQGVLRTAASGVPRIDHDPVTGECKGLLIEEARTNLLKYSEQFDDAAWTKTDASVSANATTAPDGTLTADKLIENTADAGHQLSQDNSLKANVVYTLSVYAKAAERPRMKITTSNTGNWAVNATATFDLTTGTVINGTGTITPVGNGWYCCSTKGTFGDADATGGINIFPVRAGEVSQVYTGDDTSGIYVWGAQLEAGPFPTSYIPTSSAAATRAADAASMTGTNFSEWFRQDEGAFVVAAATAAALRNRGAFSVSDGTLDNTINVYNAADGDAVNVQIRTAGVTNAFLVNGASTAYKLALSYRINDFASSLNGSAVITDKDGPTLAGINRLTFGQLSPSGSLLNGHIRRIAYYTRHLANAELQAITA